MSDQIKKEDLKKALTEALEPFAGSIKNDFNRLDERFDRIDGRVANLEVGMEEIKSDAKETKEIMNQLFNRIDKFLIKLEILDQEFTIIKEDLKRVKMVIKEKLGVDLN